MVRPERIDPITWDGTVQRAAELDSFCRDSALVPRWQWNPALSSEARVLVAPAEGEMHSAEWVIVPEGASVYRLDRDDQDSPLRLRGPDGR